MSNKPQLPYYSKPGDKDGDTVYFLRNPVKGGKDTEINEEQYQSLVDLHESSSGGSLNESDIIRLHQESDPASEHYKGKPVNNEVEEPKTVGTAPAQGSPYYELNEEQLQKVNEIAAEGTAGTTTHSTEDVTKSNSTAKVEETKAAAASSADATAKTKSEETKK